MQGLRIKQIETKTGLKKSKIYQLISDGKLPHPMKIGKASVWIEDEVNEALEAISKEQRLARRVRK